MSLRYCSLLTLLCSMVTGAAQGSQYCHGICGNKSTHTLCRFQRPGPGQMCVGYIRSRLTPSEKARIVARLNQRRNQAAMGHLMGLPPATNMMKLRWVEELAMSAQRWADQCMPPATPDQRDECRDLYMATAGQAVGSIVGDAPGLRVEALIDSWYMQSLVYRGNVTSYEPAPYDKSFYGDFTQMMWAKSYMVGCGRSRFMTMQGSRHTGVVRLVCNFVPRGNLRARPVWMPGAPCARCPADTDCYADSPALCHYPETKEDLFAAVERAQYKYAVQAPHVKVRRELRERAIDELYTTPAPPSPAPLPPLLAKLVHYLPFLAYEARNGAWGGGDGGAVALSVACAAFLCLLE